MKKFIVTSIALVASLALAFTIAGCGEQKVQEGVYKKVADGLYEVTYSDYDVNYGNQKSEEGVFSLKNYSKTRNGAGCSSVRNDNYVGRNFDVPYGDSAEVIVHTTAKDGRYASVGSFNCGMILDGDNLTKKELGDAAYNLMPFAIVDGINEKGLVVESNVTPAKDIGLTTGTNPGKPDLNILNIGRFLLDKAATAKEAVDMLDQYNISNTWDWAQMNKVGYEVHYMIADSQDTYVVEFINNKVVVQKDKQVLTNYYLGVEGGTDNGMGIERLQILTDNKSMATSSENMAKLMEKVYYTKTSDVNLEPYCYSDHFGITKDDADNPIVLSNYNTPENKAKLKKAGEETAAATAEMLKTGTNPDGIWITLHTCVFDMKACNFTFSMKEHPEKTWTFGIK